MRGTWSFARLCWGLLIVIGMVACHPSSSGAPLEPLDDARRRAWELQRHLDKHPDDPDARLRLAALEWSWLRNPEAARRTLERMGDSPLALLASLQIAAPRDEHERARTLAWRILDAAGRADFERPGATQDPAWQLATASAAAWIADLDGDLPDDDAWYAKHFAVLRLRALAPEARRELIGLHADRQRRQGGDYRAAYAAQGCVQNLSVGAAEPLPWSLDLAASRSRAYVRDGDVKLIKLACATRLWREGDGPELRRFRTTLRTVRPGMVLDVAGQSALQVWVDGQRVHRTDRHERYLAKRRPIVVDVAAGEHDVEIIMPVARRRSWLLLRATHLDGEPVVARASDTHRAGGDAPVRQALDLGDAFATAVPGGASAEVEPLIRLTLLQLALELGDSDTAETHARALESYPEFAEGALWRAGFERADPSRGAGVSLGRERAALERAVELEPALGMARAGLLRLMVRRDEVEASVNTLEAAPEGSLGGVQGELLRYHIYRLAGDQGTALAALERAHVLHPTSCSVLHARRAHARAFQLVALEDEATKALARCPGTLETRARWHQQRGRLEDARRLWQQELERQPDDTGVLSDLWALSRARADAAAMRRGLRALERYEPEGHHLQRADLELSLDQHDAATRSLATAVAAGPSATRTRAVVELVGVEDELLQYRIDGQGLIAEYLPQRAAYGAAEQVLVLDRSVARVYPDGSQRQIVHLIVELRSKQALDQWGELQQADGDVYWTLRSIKPDGEVHDAEIIAGKDGVSLRHLEVGDFVELEYVSETPPSYEVPGLVEVSPFRFQSELMPYHRTELWVVHPEAFALQTECRNGCPPVVRSREGGLTVLKFRADGVMPRKQEAHGRSPVDELPVVSLMSAFDVRHHAVGVARRVAPALRTNPELRARAAELVASAGPNADAVAQARAVWTWVRETIEPSGDLTGPATATLADRSGNTMALAMAMLQAAGIEFELHLARSRFAPRLLPGGNPMLGSYDTPMVVIRGRDPVALLSPHDGVPFGYVPSAYVGASSIRVPLTGEASAEPVKMPADPAGQSPDRRSYALKLDVSPNGAAQVEGTITLMGGEAIAWRQLLKRVDPDRHEEVFQQVELNRLGGTGALRSLKIEGAKDDDGPLTLQFAASLSGFAIRQTSRVHVPVRIVAADPFGAYAQLPRRESALLMSYAPRVTVSAELTLPGPAEPIAPVEVQGATGYYRREVTAEQNRWTVHTDSAARPGIVEVADYAALRALAEQVAAAERVHSSVAVAAGDGP